MGDTYEPPVPQPIAYDPVMMQQVMADSAATQTAAYVDGQKQMHRLQMKWLPEDYPMVEGLRRDSELLDRQAMIDFLNQYGLEAQQAMLASNPALAKSLGYVESMADATKLTPEITAELDRQALEGITGMGALTAEEMRMSDQAARESYAARGMVMSDPAVVAEVMNRQSMMDSRLAEDRTFAYSREMGNRNFVQSSTQIADATSAGMKMLGMPTGSAQGMSNTMGMVSGVRTPDPAATMAAGLGYYGDIQGYNANMETSMYNSYNNNQAALEAAQLQAAASGAAASSAASSSMMSAGIGAAGAAIGAAAVVCWVAREVYGAADGRWRTFRVWLLLTAPTWLRRAYVRHGEAFAEMIQGRAAVKALLRHAMDTVAR